MQKLWLVVITLFYVRTWNIHEVNRFRFSSRSLTLTLSGFLCGPVASLPELGRRWSAMLIYTLIFDIIIEVCNKPLHVMVWIMKYIDITIDLPTKRREWEVFKNITIWKTYIWDPVVWEILMITVSKQICPSLFCLLLSKIKHMFKKVSVYIEQIYWDEIYFYIFLHFSSSHVFHRYVYSFL